MKQFAIAVVFALSAGFGPNAAADDSLVNAGLNLSASGWNSIIGPSRGTGELRLDSNMNSFAQNATGFLSLGTNVNAAGFTVVGPGGGSANVGFNVFVANNGMAGFLAPIPPGDVPGWQGVATSTFKFTSLYASSSGDGQASANASVNTFAGGNYTPPAPVKGK